MPALQPAPPQAGGSKADDGELHFPPVTRDHILHCSYDYWFPKYRTSCIRSRIIPLTPEFLEYIREDGIILADDDSPKDTSNSAAKGEANGDDDDDDDDDWEPTVSSHSFRPSEAPAESDSEDDSDPDAEPTPPKLPPNRRFPALHAAINSAIASLGGAAAPKLNWSSPKDATWISRHPNTVKCTEANDVYILLKSSSFVSHDLDHAFDDTVPTSSSSTTSSSSSSSNGNTPFSPVLVLRSFFNPLPSLEFRCFVKDRNLVAITQRDLNHYAFLRSLRPDVVARARELFARLRFTFPEACFVFDVYIPETDSYSSSSSSSSSGGDDDDDNEKDKKKKNKNSTRLGRARLIDINPWAPRTDSLLFGWEELLGIQVKRPFLGPAVSMEEEGGDTEASTTEDEDESEEEEDEYEPELRLVEHDDPAAYNFSSPQYSAHKLPKDVVDASLAGEGGMREFAQRWQRIVGGQTQEWTTRSDTET